MRKQVMTMAWEIARKGKNNFGGKVIEYLSESLKLAWAKVKQLDEAVEVMEKYRGLVEKIKQYDSEAIGRFEDINALTLSNKTKDQIEMFTQNMEILKLSAQDKLNKLIRVSSYTEDQTDWVLNKKYAI